MNEVSDALGTALTGDATLMALVTDRVYDHIPENTAFPYVEIGDAFESQTDTFGTGVWDVLLTIHIWSRAKGFFEAWNIADRISVVLDRAALTLASLTHISTQRETASTFRDQDGVSRQIVQQFRVRVQE